MARSLRLQAASGVMWSAAQMWLVRATAAGAFIVISRQLQPSEFGLVALAMSVIAVLQLLSDSGMATYLIRTADLDEKHRSTAFWTTLLLAVVLAGALAALAGPVAGLFDEPGLAPVLVWLSAGLVLTGLGSVPTALMRREMRFKSLAIRGTIATMVGSVVAIVLALAGAGVWALVAQNLVRAGISVVITWSVVRWFPRFVLDRAEARTMLSFGSKLLGVDLLLQARTRGEEFVLAGMGSSALLGLWSVANRLVKIIQETGSSVVNTVATPAFARLQDDLPRLHRAYESALYTAGLVMFPAMLFLAVTSPYLVPFLLGAQWAPTAGVAQIIAVTAALGVFSQFDRAVFVAVGKLRPEVVMVTGIVVTQLVLVVVLVPHGLTWVALGLLARTLVSVPVRQLVIQRTVGIPVRSTVKALRVLAAALVMAGALWAVDTWLLAGLDTWARILLAAVVAVVVYVPALLLLARPVFSRVLGDVRSLRGGRRGRSAPVPAPDGGPVDPEDVVEPISPSGGAR
ncbi:O-antigen/teichoic acid export membrane protein [Kineococcus radiotolerans]|uniref:O-antigen/teichoic acid export membrane protein n=1 Tax=Kineococcus radiotolerans TaxID=131568 RepID=A0A7W4TN57_KINRA|nr:lipopolysaccharide biosynthesis protein [Kineococcus radiotolerans]MBB2902004.1 O-antigen/teichoic acid export membrane protein [Kineococcus radiotolerans]